MIEHLDTLTLVKSELGYEMRSSDGGTFASFKTWEPIAQLFRQADYSEEYIASRKSKADAGVAARIDESDE
jgi:hypothetical protein